MLNKWLEKLKTKFKTRLKTHRESSENEPKGKRIKRLLWPLLGAVAVLCVLGGVGMSATSSNKFCISCHEMAPEAMTTQLTSRCSTLGQ